MEKTASIDTAATRVCRSCRHRPRHWTRWQSANEVWFDGRCLTARKMVRPESICGAWEGWVTGGEDDNDGE